MLTVPEKLPRPGGWNRIGSSIESPAATASGKAVTAGT
jgi:hypothetical protein